MAEDLKTGLFITFEGPEGSGKSTHSRRVVKDLTDEGYDVVHTHEPGGTALGQKIRDILLEKKEIRLDKYSELLLFEADRSQHIEEVIRPALKDKKIIICDRFNTATFAYQGYGLGMDMKLIETLDAASTCGIGPDLTVLLDIEVETGLERAGGVNSADRMEKRGIEFHNKVRKGYLALAEQSPDTVKVVKVSRSIDETYSCVKELVYACIERNKRPE